MNDQVKNFIANIGVLCEQWTIVYRSFIAQGLNHKDALEHTREFTAALMSSMVKDNGGK